MATSSVPMLTKTGKRGVAGLVSSRKTVRANILKLLGFTESEADSDAGAYRSRQATLAMATTPARAGVVDSCVSDKNGDHGCC
jgi:hypothetical protein